MIKNIERIDIVFSREAHMKFKEQLEGKVLGLYDYLTFGGFLNREVNAEKIYGQKASEIIENDIKTIEYLKTLKNKRICLWICMNSNEILNLVKALNNIDILENLVQVIQVNQRNLRDCKIYYKHLGELSFHEIKRFAEKGIFLTEREKHQVVEFYEENKEKEGLWIFDGIGFKNVKEDKYDKEILKRIKLEGKAICVVGELVGEFKYYLIDLFWIYRIGKLIEKGKLKVLSESRDIRNLLIK